MNNDKPVDLHDQASELEQFNLDLSMHASRSFKSVAVATGKCLHCGDPVGEGLRWCDKHCRNDWEKFNPGA